ncbi:cephalosporin hydroxylase family protein [Allorhodopirellula solitaria]|uniref:Rhamnosyl O-methyltransferase n=1 Tax=Allorhodopirellula solitaria TaxID=2527987 RepID=A0A5C5X269_9BACT|nr:cephalosporin hydroxylase family protein [Allorhodopirellula solitaria]TWT56351.1 Rhamnosyl O-methyltransferase precursor [Allorhodopirellula solitaria]
MTSIDPTEEFRRECHDRVEGYADSAMAQSGREFMRASTEPKYSYNFSWLGRPIIQYPQDMIAMQQLIWRIQPDLIIETGIAHGGSLIFSASMLELNAACGGPADARVLGIDIDIRQHNRQAIIDHPMAKRINMIEGSSVAPEIVQQVRQQATGKRSVMVCLDSNHTHDHVLAELNAYADLTSVGSYCVVFDTIVEDLPSDMYPDRSWGPGNSPKSAVKKFLQARDDFEVDTSIDNQLLISVAPQGYLRRLR